MADRRLTPAALMAALAAVAVLWLPLVQPNHPAALTPGALRVFPLELPALVLLLLIAPRRPVRLAVAGFLWAMCLLKLADLGTNIAYLRPFNPLLDVNLLPASWRLVQGSVGWPAALGLVIATLAAALLLAAALWWATGRIARHAPRRRLRLAQALALAVALAATDAAREIRPVDLPGAAFTGRLAYEHGRDMLRTRADLARFRVAAARDDYAGLPPDRLLTRLRDTDVLLIFVESYGRTALENPRYAPAITATLDRIGTDLAAHGYATRSAYLTAPMTGGQSWLAHSSVLAGLWIENQGRYEALLASPRRTLLHLARAAGWETVAVMPGITLGWPEAGYFGYDRIIPAAALDYAGAPFNWVTMPDQFTLASFARKVLDPRPRKPVFAAIALISSHAPWTPIAPLLPWDDLGDGRIFTPFATAGDPPDVVWRDLDRVRDQYRRSIDYVLQAVGGFAARQAGGMPLIVVLGDHQPTAFVAGDSRGRDVPVHLIGPPDLVDLVSAWDWTPGMRPAADAPAWPMDAFRDRFLAAFGPEPAGTEPRAALDP